MSSADARLAEFGIQLPDRRRSAGDYVGFVQAGDLLFLSGQGSEGHVGRVGAELDLEGGRRAARTSALNLLTQTRLALGSLASVRRVVRVHGFVACSEEFAELPRVVDGASELLHAVFGAEVGPHARSAIGVQSLPFGLAVEVEMIVQVSGA
jgi:enamine deaminase RidA (YjgF/YER057c/UK114 family)